jgi:aryl-alcohol dehydrogenase-like predicted oxidoreductase
MNTRVAKRLNVWISEIGLGGWQLGRDANCGPTSFIKGVELVKTAYTKRINFFDIAPGYSNGLSEKIIGSAFKDHRKDVFINTEFGHSHLNQAVFSEGSIEKSINECLERLQMSYVDPVIFHNPPINLGREDVSPNRVLMLEENRKIRGFGVNIDTLEDLELVLNHLDVDVIEILSNINHQSPKILFDQVKAKGILLIAKVLLDSDWPSGEYNVQSNFTGIRSRRDLSAIHNRAKSVDKIKAIVQDDNFINYALRFILSFDAMTTVIPGVKDLNQLDSNIEASEFQLSVAIKQAIEKLYEDEIKFMN